MSLLEFLASRVPKARQLRGDTYYAQGRVLFVAATERGLDYRVRGTETYRVTLQLAGRTLHTSCTCPFTGEGMCKHVWAALREAETAGRLAADGTEPGAGSAPPGPPAPSSDHAWRELVAAAGEGARPGPPSRFDPATTDVVPMIDLDAAGEGTVLTIRLMRRDRRADGALSDPKPLAITYAEAAAFAREEDRRLFALIRGADAEGIGFSDWRAYSRTPNPARVAGDGVGIALYVLASTGRSLVRSEAIAHPAPLAVDGGGAWAFEVEVREAGPDGRRGCGLWGRMQV